MTTHMPFFTRSSRPAPKFWPVKVVAAMLKLVTGRMLKPSIFRYAPQPAMALVPKTLTLDCTSTLEKAMTIFWMPVGRPTRMMRFASLGLMRMSPSRTR